MRFVGDNEPEVIIRKSSESVDSSDGLNGGDHDRGERGGVRVGLFNVDLEPCFFPQPVGRLRDELVAILKDQRALAGVDPLAPRKGAGDGGFTDSTWRVHEKTRKQRAISPNIIDPLGLLAAQLQWHHQFLVEVDGISFHLFPWNRVDHWYGRDPDYHVPRRPGGVFVDEINATTGKHNRLPDIGG